MGEVAVQLHGAIGMTEEYEVGQANKRLAAAANQWGDAHWHGDRLLGPRAPQAPEAYLTLQP